MKRYAIQAICVVIATKLLMSIVVTLLYPIWTLVMWVFHDTADVSASEAEYG